MQLFTSPYAISYLNQLFYTVFFLVQTLGVRGQWEIELRVSKKLGVSEWTLRVEKELGSADGKGHVAPTTKNDMSEV